MAEPKRKRAAAACQSCRTRRVRCTVSTTGPPCVNCSLDDVPCIVQERKRRAAQAASSSSAVVPSVRPPRPCPGAHRTSSEHADAVQTTTQDVSGLSMAGGAPSNSTPLEGSPYRRAPSPERVGDYLAGRSEGITTTPAATAAQTDVASVFDAVVDGGSQLSAVPYYVGDHQGIRFMLDLCRPDRQLESNHYPLPRQWLSNGTSSSHQAYRSCLGDALTVFSENVSRELIISYFHHVHPVLPILNPKAFLKVHLQKQTAGPETSFLLLKCIYFAGASQVGETTIKEAGFSTRGELRDHAFAQVKLLYNTGLETDKETLVQCSLLMSFWYSAPDDPLGPWHWNGVAIGLCHSLGLHRRFKATPARQPSFSATKQSLWSRIWWTCYVREVWLALSYGRPLRINIEDCDAPVPSVEDVVGEPDEVSQDDEQLYLPIGLEASARVYVQMIKLSFAVAKILANHYRPGRRPSPADIRNDEEDIRRNEKDIEALGNSPYEQVQTRIYSIQLYLQAVIIVLYRPYVLVLDAEDQESLQTKLWHAEVRTKLRTATANVLSILNKLIVTESVKSAAAHAYIVTAIKPAMQICLSDMLSPNTFTRRHAANQIDLCMLVLGELRDSLYSADLTYSLFELARRKIESRQRAQHDRSKVRSEIAALSQQSTSNINRNVPEDSQRQESTRQSGLGDATLSWSERQQHSPDNSLGMSTAFGEESWQRPELDALLFPWDLNIESILGSEDFNYALL